MSSLTPLYADSSSRRIEPQSHVVGSDVPDSVDSNVPDVVHAKTGQKGGKKVSVSDVLRRQEGDDVWVVIKGDVYE